MAFTPEQLIEGFRSASQGGQVTELYNALRDFRLDIDRQKLSSMSDTDLKRLWVEMGADPIRGQLSPKQRRGIIEGMSDRFKKQQKIITRDIQNAQGTGTFAENHRKDLQKTVEKYIKGAAEVRAEPIIEIDRSLAIENLDEKILRFTNGSARIPLWLSRRGAFYRAFGFRYWNYAP